MKILKKLFKYVLVPVGILLILGLGALYLFFPKEKAKEMATQKISSALDREVIIDDISVSIWGGIGANLEGIKIANANGFEPNYFIEAENLDIKLQIWPLINNELAVDRMILNKPVIHLTKKPNGKVNYQFETIDSAAEASGAPGDMSDESKLALSAVSLDDFQIKDGALIYADDSSHSNISIDGMNLATNVKSSDGNIFESNGEIDIESFTYKDDSLSILNLPIKAEYDSRYNMAEGRFTLSENNLTVNEIKAKYSAEMTTTNQGYNYNIGLKSENIDITKLVEIVPPEYKDLISEFNFVGNLGITGTVTGSDDSLDYSLDIPVEKLTIQSDSIPGDIVLASSSILINPIDIAMILNECSWAGNPFKGEVKATYNESFDDYKIVGALNGSLDLAETKILFPDLESLEFAGAIDYDIKFDTYNENYSDAKLSGTTSLRNVSYRAETLPENIENLNAEIIFDNRDINIDKLDIEFESSDLSLTGNIKNAFPYFIPEYSATSARPYLSFALKSNHLDVDKLFPEAAPGEGSSFSNVPADSIPPIIIPDIDGSGTGEINTLIYSGVEFTNLNSKIDIKDRKVKISEATGNIYTGEVSGETEIDLNDFNNPVFTGSYDAKNIEANDFLTRFSNLGGQIYGKANLAGKFNASGLEPEDLINSLSMDGDAFFAQAKLMNFDFIQNISNQFNLDWKTEESLKDIAAKFAVNNGRVEFKDMGFVNRYGDWDIVGSVGIVDGSLDYSCNLKMDKATAEMIASKFGISSNLVSLIKDKNSGKYLLPFSIGGTYKKPSAKLDLDLNKMMQDNLQDNISDGIKKLFGN